MFAEIMKPIGNIYVYILLPQQEISIVRKENALCVLSIYDIFGVIVIHCQATAP